MLRSVTFQKFCQSSAQRSNVASNHILLRRRAISRRRKGGVARLPPVAMFGKPPSTLSKEGFKQHYAKVKGLDDDKVVFFWHAHSYGNSSDPAQKEALEQWFAHLQAHYASNSEVDLGRLHKDPVGPHPVGSFQLAFTREAFTDVLTHLQFYRPAPVSIMIHPHTLRSWLDHTERALWLGKQLALNAGAPAMLEQFDKKMASEIAEGADPFDVLWTHHN